MDLKTALDLSRSYVDSFQDLWKFYYTMAFAVLGFVVSARNYLDRLRGFLIALGFAWYAWVNFSGLETVRLQRKSIYALVRQAAHQSGAALPARFDVLQFKPLLLWKLAAGHLFFDLFIVGLIIGLTYNLHLRADGAIYRSSPKR